MPCMYGDSLTGRGCQFNEPEEDLNKYAPHLTSPKFCILHLTHQWKVDWQEERIAEFNKVFFKYFDQYENTLTEAISFNGVVFPGDLDLSNRRFSKGLSFSHCHFMRGLRLEKSTLNSIQIFQSNIDSGLSFDNSKAGSLVVSGSKLGGPLTVTAARVGFLDFVSCSVGLCTFENSSFDIAQFVGCIFRTEIDFRGITVAGITTFRDAKFSGPMCISGAAFSSDVDISSRIPDSEMPAFDATGSKFRGQVNFVNRAFTDSTSFARCLFAKAPLFYGGKLHQDTNFHGAVFSDTSFEAARAYRTLKLAMEGVRARAEEGRFYSYEQRCLRRNPDLNKFIKLISWAYEVSSDYGMDVIKPLEWLIYTFLAFFAIYVGISFSVQPYYVDAATRVRDIVNYTMVQVVRPFSVWNYDNGSDSVLSRLFKYEGSASEIVRVLSSIQSLLTLTLLALLILALRWRFKRS